MNSLSKRLARLEALRSLDPAKMDPGAYADWVAAWWARVMENGWRQKEGKEPLPEIPLPPPVPGGIIERLIQIEQRRRNEEDAHA